MMRLTTLLLLSGVTAALAQIGTTSMYIVNATQILLVATFTTKAECDAALAAANSRPLGGSPAPSSLVCIPTR